MLGILQARALALTAGAALMPQVTFDMGINAQPAALRFAPDDAANAEGVYQIVRRVGDHWENATDELAESYVPEQPPRT